MKIKLKLPAVVTDGEGHDQNIEVDMEFHSLNYSRTEGTVKGFFIIDDYGMITGSFSFKEEHPFNAFPHSHLPRNK